MAVRVRMEPPGFPRVLRLPDDVSQKKLDVKLVPLLPLLEVPQHLRERKRVEPFNGAAPSNVESPPQEEALPPRPRDAPPRETARMDALRREPSQPEVARHAHEAAEEVRARLHPPAQQRGHAHAPPRQERAGRDRETVPARKGRRSAAGVAGSDWESS